MPAIGYARVSTDAQDLALQCDALAKVGCEKIFEDVASGAKADRPGLTEALRYLREGDVLVVWKFDRLGRSLPHLIETVSNLQERGIGLRSLTENIDTTTPGGKLVFSIFGALAEFERNLIRERTAAGLKAAAARGRKGGRKRVVTTNSLEREYSSSKVSPLETRRHALRSERPHSMRRLRRMLHHPIRGDHDTIVQFRC